MHLLANAAAEGLNSNIQTIKKMAYSSATRSTSKRPIFFHCGELQLYPAIPLTHGNPR